MTARSCTVYLCTQIAAHETQNNTNMQKYTTQIKYMYDLAVRIAVCLHVEIHVLLQYK